MFPVLVSAPLLKRMICARRVVLRTSKYKGMYYCLGKPSKLQLPITWSDVSRSRVDHNSLALIARIWALNIMLDLHVPPPIVLSREGLAAPP